MHYTSPIKVSVLVIQLPHSFSLMSNIIRTVIHFLGTIFYHVCKTQMLFSVVIFVNLIIILGDDLSSNTIQRNHDTFNHLSYKPPSLKRKD